MANKEIHPCFEPPKNTDVKIWRYMDFTKYVSLLESRSLFFSRSDLFNDPYEGATSHLNALIRPKLYPKFPDKLFTDSSKFAEWVRQWTFINCWHMNAHESAAMWKLYARTNEAVAIQSTYQRLYSCVKDNAYIGVVKYIDYEKEWLPEGNSFWPFVHKRKSFEHEMELRAVIQELPLHEDCISVGLQNHEIGKLISIKPEDLITNVYVAPSAPEWFAILVQVVTKKFGFNFEVNQSLLSKKPVF